MKCCRPAGRWRAAAGVSIALSRNILLLVAATLTATATILVGPLGFAGPMGPHPARLWGSQRAGLHLVASSLTGGLILMTADWIGRNIVFPFQFPQVCWRLS
ncbi:iron chelate uptake ABC transporter family permease subunit [Shinella sp. PSBB067]|uniref:iron chelate uptake ABC transporter family permease subunit n=1 Tax=Shinella sp. PSBB067 TaxID=2715959 RepID=UPI001E2A3E29|nr:iron chelate uptake ABC transporter family permease subunit [Shinella sp. PSBB067]